MPAHTFLSISARNGFFPGRTCEQTSKLSGGSSSLLALHDGTSGGAAWTIQAHGILLHFFRILLGPVCSVQNPPGQSFVVSEMFPLPKSEATDLPICALPMKLRLSWVHWALEEFVLLWVDIGISEDNLVCHWEREVFECSALGGRWTPINGAL